MLRSACALVIGGLLCCSGCKSYEEQRNELPDTPDRGSVRISADETFKPIVDELVQVYESNHPGTSISVTYKTEADCLRDLLNDSIRMVFVTRRPSAEEKVLLADSLKVNPRSLVVARDGIAVVVHPGSADTIFTMQEIKEILTGKHNKKLIPVFDGIKATSTVRFIVDSADQHGHGSPQQRGCHRLCGNASGRGGFCGSGLGGEPRRLCAT
jgi:phosphate transport system substrate-binding protein